MGFIRKIVGPGSKYDDSLPYTYEARLPLVEGTQESLSYIADTVCGLIEYLDKQDIAPHEVQLYEIYQNREEPLNMALFISPDRKWLFKPEICQSLKDHYKGHIHDGTCSFADRSRKGSGP